METSQNDYQAQLKKSIDELDSITAPYCKDDEQDLLVTVLDKNYYSAENQEQNDFFTHNLTIKEQLSLHNLEAINEYTKGLTAKILCEYCKYSMVDFNDKAERFRCNLTNNSLNKMRSHINRERTAKDSLKVRIIGFLQKTNPQKTEIFQKLLYQINILNFLNLNIEAKFSFKGWPGLFHYLVYRKGKYLSSMSDIHKRQRDLYSTVTSDFRFAQKSNSQ